jgi:ArsR family transcriptional regulator
MLVDVDATEGVLRAIAEPARWRIVQLLAAEELCVCHLVEELHASQPVVSHHLRVLRDAGLVETERHRYWTYYRLRPEAVATLISAFDALARHARRAARNRRPCC